MDVKVCIDKDISRWVDCENPIYDKKTRIKKPHITTKKVINSRKTGKTMSEVKPVENISKNLQSFLEIISVQKDVLLSHKLQDHAYK